MANIPEIKENKVDEENDNKKGIFEKTELLFKRITIGNTQAGIVWKCTAEGCTYSTGEKQRIRNHLASMRRKTNDGKVYLPYCEKTHT